MTVTEVDLAEGRRGAVRLLACGVCHTDPYTASGVDPSGYAPTVLGHEGAGVVETVGRGVRSLAIGDHVVTLFSPQCRECVHCHSSTAGGSIGYAVHPGARPSLAALAPRFVAGARGIATAIVSMPGERFVRESVAAFDGRPLAPEILEELRTRRGWVRHFFEPGPLEIVPRASSRRRPDGDRARAGYAVRSAAPSPSASSQRR